MGRDTGMVCAFACVPGSGEHMAGAPVRFLAGRHLYSYGKPLKTGVICFNIGSTLYALHYTASMLALM
jgi:hypothetical protein